MVVHTTVLDKASAEVCSVAVHTMFCSWSVHNHLMAIIALLFV